MRDNLEKKFGWVLFICITLAMSMTTAFGKSGIKDIERDGGNIEKDSGGEPSCHC